MATADTTRARPLDAPRSQAGPSRLATETKASLKTSELYVYLVVLLGILIAGAATKAGNGHDDRFLSRHVWLYATILTVGYLVSRGLAKSGSRDPYWDASGDNRNRDGAA